MPDSTPPPLFDEAQAAFMQGGVSITIAACSAAAIPEQARGGGCRISPDRRRLTVFISSIQGEQVLRCVREHGAIAVVFSQPSSHRTLQLKGRDAAAGLPDEGDLKRIAAYREAFAAELAPLGFEPELVRALFAYPDSEILALSFTPCAAFSQTPGPRAGEPLRSGA